MNNTNPNVIDMELIRRAAADMNGVVATATIVQTQPIQLQPAYITSAIELAQLGVPIELISATQKRAPRRTGKQPARLTLTKSFDDFIKI